MADVFPVIIFIESLIAAFVYLLKGDTLHAIYWLAGATITITVTMMGGGD